MSSLKDRLALAFDPQAKHTQAGLARAAKVSAASVSDWFSGETKSLKAESLIRAAIYLGVSPLWLATGEGAIRSEGHEHAEQADSTQDRAAAINWPVEGLTIAEIHERLNTECRAQVAGFVKAMLLASNSGSLSRRTTQKSLGAPIAKEHEAELDELGAAAERQHGSTKTKRRRVS